MIQSVDALGILIVLIGMELRGVALEAVALHGLTRDYSTSLALSAIHHKDLYRFL